MKEIWFEHPTPYFPDLHYRSLCLDGAENDSSDIENLLWKFVRKNGLAIAVELFPQKKIFIHKGFLYFDNLQWYEVYTILRNAGYTFTEEVQKWYEHLTELHEQAEKEKAERKEEEREEKELQEEQAKPVVEIISISWCGKYDCQTKSDCYLHCKYAFTGCQPSRIRVKTIKENTNV